MHILLIHSSHKQTNGGNHHNSIRSFDRDNHIIEVLTTEDTKELHATLDNTLRSITISRHDTITQRTMIHTYTNSSMMLLADIEERHQLTLYLLKFSSILLISILKMLECTSWIYIVTRIDTYLLTILCCDISGMSCEMYICHKRSIVAISLKTCRDILHILCLTSALSGESHQFSSCIDYPLCLSHTTIGIVGINSTHRLDTYRIRASDADIADTSLR